MAATRLTTSTTTAAGNYFIVGGQGATLASASTITITDSFHEVSGAVTINTINGGVAGQGLFLYRPTGATWALGSGGNIKATADTTAERTILLVTPNGTTWYGPSGVNDLGSLSGTVAIANGGTGQTTATAAFDALAPTTTQGDIIYHNGTDNVRLAKGTAAQFLAMNGGATAPAWTSTLAIANGGTGQTTATAAFDALAPTTTTGDTIYYNGTDNVRLAKGAAKTLLQINSGATAPEWTATPTVTSLTSATATLTGSTNFFGITAGAGSGSLRLGGTIGKGAPALATTGTSEEVLATVTIPANTLSENGAAIHVNFFAHTAANGNNKTLRIRIGGIAGTIVCDTGAIAANNLNIRSYGPVVITRLTALTATSASQGPAGADGDAAPASWTTWNSKRGASIDWTAAQDLVITAITPTSAGDLTLDTYSVAVLQ